MGHRERMEDGLPRQLCSALSFWVTALGWTAFFVATELAMVAMVPSLRAQEFSLGLINTGFIMWLTALYAICRRRKYRWVMRTPWKVYLFLWTVFVYGFVLSIVAQSHHIPLLSASGLSWLVGAVALLVTVGLLQNDPRREPRPARPTAAELVVAEVADLGAGGMASRPGK